MIFVNEIEKEVVSQFEILWRTYPYWAAPHSSPLSLRERVRVRDHS